MILVAYPETSVYDHYDLLVGLEPDVKTFDYEGFPSYLGPRATDVRKSAAELVNASEEGTLIVPGSEVGVLVSGLATETGGLPGLRLDAAVACVDRFQQRLTLSPLEINPQWTAVKKGEPNSSKILLRSFPMVVKAPSSTLSRGVRIVYNNDELEQAIRELPDKRSKQITRIEQALGYSLDYEVVIEEFIEGNQYEISGVVTTRGKVFHWFQPLHQVWDKPLGEIINYQVVEPTDRVGGRMTDQVLQEMAKEVVDVLDLTWCAFCIEFRGPPWGIVEVHARLGVDGGDYYDKLSPGKHPLVVTCEVLRGEWKRQRESQQKTTVQGNIR